MLKNIPSLISPELLKILMEMGHGDEIVIGDGNFPAAAYAKRLVRLDGLGVPEILEAMLQLLPLDRFEANAFLMEKVPGDKAETPIWETYKEIAKKGDFDEVKVKDTTIYFNPKEVTDLSEKVVDAVSKK